MPPIKNYVFVDLDDSNINITILAYSFVEAYEKLVSITKNPANFIIIDL